MILKEKVAIVTGARRGIGYGIVHALAKEGCNVVVSDVSQEDCAKVVAEIESMGVKGLAVKCDVTNKVDLESLVAKTMEKFGKMDILVNNAGIFPFVPFASMTEADWDKVLDINLKSVFMLSQLAARSMKPGSKIVSVSSIAGVIGYTGLAHYCASKAGIMGLTRALALELAPGKINVNSVAPGAIDTPGARETSDPNVMSQFIQAIPWKRMGTAEDIANAVVFLSSTKSDYITGQTIIVDGGWTIQ